MAQVSPFDQKHKLSKELLATDKTEEAVPLPVIAEPEIEEETAVEEPAKTEEVAASPPEITATPIETSGDTSEQALLNASKPTKIDQDEEEDEAIVTPVGTKGKNQPLFLFLMLIAATILTTLTISSNKSLVNNILRAVLNDNYLNLMYREQKKTGTFHYYILYFVFAVNAGLFLYFILTRLVFNDSIPLLWQCVLLIGLIYICRHLFMTYMAYVYSFNKEVEQYAFTILIFNIFLGLLLLPINVFIAFSPEPIGFLFLYGGLIIVLIVYVFRQLRGVFISSRLLVNNKFYFLLYICAVEIAPILLLVKYSGAYVS